MPVHPASVRTRRLRRDVFTVVVPLVWVMVSVSVSVSGNLRTSTVTCVTGLSVAPVARAVRAAVRLAPVARLVSRTVRVGAVLACVARRAPGDEHVVPGALDLQVTDRQVAVLLAGLRRRHDGAVLGVACHALDDTVSVRCVRHQDVVHLQLGGMDHHRLFSLGKGDRAPWMRWMVRLRVVGSGRSA